MINPIVYADLKRIVRNLRCGGMSDADVMFEVAEMLKYGLYGDANGEDFE